MPRGRHLPPKKTEEPRARRATVTVDLGEYYMELLDEIVAKMAQSNRFARPKRSSAIRYAIRAYHQFIVEGKPASAVEW